MPEIRQTLGISKTGEPCLTDCHDLRTLSHFQQKKNLLSLGICPRRFLIWAPLLQPELLGPICCSAPASRTMSHRFFYFCRDRDNSTRNWRFLCKGKPAMLLLKLFRFSPQRCYLVACYYKPFWVGRTSLVQMGPTATRTQRTNESA